MQITVRSLTGDCYIVQVQNSATVLDVKREILDKDRSLLLHKQRLVNPGRQQEDGILKDGTKLSEYGIGDGAILSLVILTPCNITVKAMDKKMHTIEVLSSEPKRFTVRELHQLVEKVVGHSMGGYQLHHQGQPVLERNAEREMTLGDYSIKADSTLVMTRMGLILNVTNPMIDVCFLVDCTGSMGRHIAAVKANILKLRQTLVDEYKGSDLLFSFVRYTDFDVSEHDLSVRTSFLPFTSNPSTFQSFVQNNVHAGGGADIAEDIMGGFKVAFSSNLQWRPASCKILIHIADAPCHGRQYHNNVGDSYPNGDPTQISHESMMAEVVRLDIQYWFGYIKKSLTDKMIDVFNESLSMQSNQRLLIRQFDAKKCEEVGEAVQRSVIASVYTKAAEEAAEEPEVITVDETLPDWNSSTIIEQGAKITSPPTKRSLFDLNHLELDEPKIDFCFKIAPNPFFEGKDYYVYYASDLVNFRKIVLKRFKQPGFNSLEPYRKELEVRTISTTYARVFNDDKLKPKNNCTIDFTRLDIIQSAGSIFYMLEQFLVGKIERFNGQNGEVANNLPHSDLLQAFSHYSWVKSEKTLLICDLQGYKLPRRDKIILTDPAIHSSEAGGKYGTTDCGKKGVEAFFSSHTCSNICEEMDLAGQTL